MTGCENRTYSTFHKTASLYYKAMNDAEAYYKSALQFLGYVDLADLSVEEQHSWAFDIGKAALLGEKVFNFGELLVRDWPSIADQNYAFRTDPGDVLLTRER
jgi:hypothetical protein